MTADATADKLWCGIQLSRLFLFVLSMIYEIEVRQLILQRSAKNVRCANLDICHEVEVDLVFSARYRYRTRSAELQRYKNCQ